MKSEQKKASNRFLELEGIRGIAAIVVVLYHFLLAFYLFSFFGPKSPGLTQHMRFEDNLYGSPFSGFISGTFAVAIFFVLSGFVLSIGYFQTGKMSIVKRLASKRYLRLMLPALASLLLCYFLIRIGASHIKEASAITNSTWLASNWNFVPHLSEVLRDGFLTIFTQDPIHSYNNVLWTMSYEFAGSFLVFLFLALFAKTPNRWVLYAILSVVTFNTWFFAFVIGMVFADMYSRGYLKQKTRSLFFALPLLLTGIYLGGYPFGNDLSGTAYFFYGQLPFSGLNYQIISLTLGAAIIVSVVLATSQVANILRKKYISKLGKYTFSLYLVHIPILYTFSSAVFVASTAHFGYNKSVLITLLASIPVVVATTILFEKYIDTNAIKFANYISDVYFGEKKIAVIGHIQRQFKKINKKLVPHTKPILPLEELE